MNADARILGAADAPTSGRVEREVRRTAGASTPEASAAEAAPRAASAAARWRRNDRFLPAVQQLVGMHGDADSSLQIGVTAIARRRGASTVACRLAESAGNLFGRGVLLVDATDVDGVRLQQDPRSRRSSAADEIIDTRHPRVKRWHVSAESVFGGPAEQAHFAARMSENRRDFAMTIFDLPAIGALAAAGPMLGELHGLVVVVQPERDRRSDLTRAREQIRRIGISIWGVILNKQRRYLPGWLEDRL